MSEKEGTLRMMASGRWAIYRPGRLPVESIDGYPLYDGEEG
jgi:hypothetical protein